MFSGNTSYHCCGFDIEVSHINLNIGIKVAPFLSKNRTGGEHQLINVNDMIVLIHQVSQLIPYLFCPDIKPPLLRLSMKLCDFKCFLLNSILLVNGS